MFKFLSILFLMLSTSNAQEFICTNDQIAKDYLNAVRSDIVGLTKYTTMPSCESNCRTTMVCGASVENLPSETVVEPSSFLIESQATTALNTLKNSKINSITVVKDGVQKTKALLSTSNFTSVSFPTTALTTTVTSAVSTFNIQAGLSLSLKKQLGMTTDERVVSKSSITVAEINTILNDLANGNPGLGVKYIVLDGTKFEISTNGIEIPQIVTVPAYTGPASGFTISGDSLAGGQYGLKKNPDNTFYAYANGVKGANIYLTTAGLLSASTTAGANVGLVPSGSGFAAQYSGSFGAETSKSGTSITRSSELTDASNNNFGLSKVSSSTFAYKYGASGAGSEISWTSIVPTAGSLTTTLYSSGSDYIKYIQDGSTGVVKNYFEYQKDGVVKYAFKTGTASNLVIAGTKYSTDVQYTLDFTVDGVNMAMEYGQYDDGTGLLLSHWVSISANLTNNGFTCPMYSSAVDIGGNIKPNMFSTKSACDLKCVEQKECIEWITSSCVMQGAVETSPITDYTGKNINTKKTYTWKCNKTTSTLERCDAYKITQLDGKLNYAASGAGWETKDFSESFAPSIASSYMAEQMQHIWTGWEGYCESGTKMDNSWMSDPMQILSLCMMAYTGAAQGAYGTAAQEATLNATNAARDAASAATGGWIADTATNTANAGKAVAGASDAVKTFDNLNTIKTFGEGASQVVIKWTDFAQMALVAISDIDNQDVQVADEYFKTQMGGVAANSEAIRYANCMASIGLSMPNMIAYAVDSNETSSQLKDPSQNPLRVTDEEMGKLLAVLGPQKMADNFRVLEYDYEYELTSLVASNGAMQTQAGQVICAGEPAVAIAMVAMQQAATEEGPDKGAAMANAAIGTALGMLPPPYNLIASVIFKIFTSISSGDACTSEKTAQQWGPEQYRTYKSLQGLQCHATKSDCVKKWFWGSCMTNGHWYCCYDQEITKIFVEGLKEQLNKGWENCSDLTIYDLKNVSFRPCEDGQSPAANKCFPKAKYTELTSALMKNATKGLSPEVIAEQAAGALTLPGRDPWAE